MWAAVRKEGSKIYRREAKLRDMFADAIATAVILKFPNRTDIGKKQNEDEEETKESVRRENAIITELDMSEGEKEKKSVTLDFTLFLVLILISTFIAILASS
ncbi:hypothetical protein K3495_g2106 [Podosphaera aphanis]|nr:hypothetical protein K3495_g2106 [Podosphaera aphanis]